MVFTPDELRQQHLRVQASLKSGARSDVRARRSSDIRQRAHAEREIEYDEQGRKIPKPMFLRPSDIAQGEKYDVERVLYTTLGQGKGEAPRRITRDDILAFQENILLLKDQYSKGITPQNVINLSHQDDIDRANKQIHLIVPASRKAGLIHFITNAGPNSKAVNHHVEVEFSNFNSVVFNINKEAISTVKNRLANGNLRFECDCGRHTYWYRYMATIGGYGLGRQEGGFPKVRNPHLTGVACKHALKVMHWISSPLGIQYLKKQVEIDRTKQLGARYKTTAKQSKEILEQQINSSSSGKARNIKANLQQAEREMIRRAEKVAREMFSKQSKEFKAIERELNRIADRQEKIGRIERLTAALNAGLITSADFDFYMKVK